MINEKELDVIFKLFEDLIRRQRDLPNVKQELKEKGILEKSALEEFYNIEGQKFKCEECNRVFNLGIRAIEELQENKDE